MATYNYDNAVSFDLPYDYELQSEFNDDGDEVFTIRGEFYLDDDLERRSRYSCRISEGTIDWDEESAGKTMVQLWAEGFAGKENIKYAALQEKPSLMLMTMGQSMLIFGRELRMMALTAFAEVGRDKFLILVGMSPYNEEDYEKDEKAKTAIDTMRKMIESISVNGRKLFSNIPDSWSLYDALKPCFDGCKPIDSGIKLNVTVKGTGTTTTYEYGGNSEEPTVTRFQLNYATPDEKLYPHYNSMKFGPAGMLSMLGAQVNTTGTEYAFQTLSKELDEFGLADEQREALQRIVNADISCYDLYRNAAQMIPLFRVDPGVFDMQHDRECELADGLMHRSYMMSALRSFAWSLSDCCTQKGVAPADLSYDELQQIIDFVSAQSWLNYDETYCKGLCGCPDLHVYYVPDGASYLDKQALLPSAEQMAELEAIKEKFPNFNQILTTVHSLDDLRKDLEYIFPAIETIYTHLEAERDRSQPLIGDAADILYAWCALALAAKEPFFTEDGPMNCWFDQKTTPAMPYAVSARPGGGTSKNQYSLPIPEHEHMEFDREGRVTYYYGDDTNLVIPRGVKIIGEDVFFMSEQLQTLVIPEGVTTIESSAFGHCKSLKSVTLPTTLKVIGQGAFAYCEALENIVFPAGLLEIGDTAFSGCKALNNVVFPEGLLEIGANAFSSCENFTDIVIPASVKKVGAEAFKFCKLLTSLVIRGTQVKFAASAVAGCMELKEIDLMPGTEVVGEINYAYCMKMGECPLPVAPEKIGEGAFSSCDGLTIFEVPDTVKSIEDEAFRFCKELRHIYIPASVTKFGRDVFQYIDTGLTVHTPAGSVAEQYAKDNGFAVSNDMTVQEVVSYKDATQNGFEVYGTTLQKFTGTQAHVVIPSGVTVIGQDVFENSAMESVEIPEGVQRIEKGAFSICTNLKKIVLPDSLEYIGYAAFDSCENLQEVVFGNNLNTIEESAFNNCGLTQVHLPDALGIIGKEAFYYCENLTDIWVSDRVYTFGENVFGPDVIPTVHTPAGSDAQKYCLIRKIPCDNQGYETEEETPEINLVDGFEIDEGRLIKYWGTEENIVVPDGVTEIECLAFSAAQFVKKIRLPDTITTICSNAFCDCKQLQEINIPESVTTIEEWAFCECEKLQELVLPKSVCDIGDYAFNTCKSLKKITWPGTAKTIRDTVLGHCDALKTVVIEEGVTKLQSYAFMGCKALTDVYMPASLQDIDEYPFLLADNVKIHAYATSFACKWAKEHNIPVIIELSPEEIAKRKAEEEQRRKAAEAQRKRQAELMEKRNRYDKIRNDIAMQTHIIEKNRGWFGAPAKARKEAQEQRSLLQAQLDREFPNGRP